MHHVGIVHSSRVYGVVDSYWRLLAVNSRINKGGTYERVHTDTLSDPGIRMCMNMYGIFSGRRV